MFDFEGQQVRMVMDGNRQSPWDSCRGNAPVAVLSGANEPWFVLADVCKVLGVSQPHLVARRMDEADVTRVRVTITQVNGESATKSMNAVNESGLYDVILDSRKPEAKKFRRWITSEVLPSLRKPHRTESEER